MVSEKSNNIGIICICPKCNKYHIVELFWTGNGIPKKFCKFCNNKISYINDTYVYIDKPTTITTKKENSE